jgi:Tol biopolymer transport system component
MSARAAFLIGWLGALTLTAAAQDPPPKLLLAISSYAERPQHPQLYFYGHDGAATGKRLGGVPAVAKRSDHHPAWTGDGRVCWFASEAEGQPGALFAYDRQEQKLIETPLLNETPLAQGAPSVTLDGRFLYAEAWSRPQFPGRWDVFRYTIKPTAVDPLIGVATVKGDERHPAVSGDGRMLAFVTNSQDNGRSDLVLWDLPTQTIVTPPGLNSPAIETEPALSGDGRWLAFASDRAGGVGARDIYLYDVAERRMVALPGLNSAGQEQSPALTADGRYLAFVSERIEGAGERDVFLYDRHTERLLPMPGLNSARDDFDPAVLLLP